jgi:hypothetical protein
LLFGLVPLEFAHDPTGNGPRRDLCGCGFLASSLRWPQWIQHKCVGDVDHVFHPSPFIVDMHSYALIKFCRSAWYQERSGV